MSSHTNKQQVPVLVIDGEQLNDSSKIVQTLSNLIRAENKKLGWGRSAAPGSSPTFSSPEEEKWFKCAPRRPLNRPARALSLAAHLHSSMEGEVARPCRWVDDRFVHVLTPNLYRTPTEALHSFDYMTSVRGMQGCRRPDVFFWGTPPGRSVCRRETLVRWSDRQRVSWVRG